MLHIEGTRDEETPLVAKERPELLLFCGIAGLVGNLIPVLAIVAAGLVKDHDWVADTISDLARGDRKWIMDVAFYFNAGGLLALAIASAHAHLGRLGWTLGLFCLSFLALVVVMLGLYDEFGRDIPEGEGMSVHTRLSFVLAPLYLAGPLLMMKGAAGISKSYGYLFAVAAGVFIVFATAFKLAPTAYDGLLEKIAVTATLLWTLPLSALFIERGLEKRDRLWHDSENTAAE